MTRHRMRYSNSKIHNIGAIVGGVVAQEAIKFITQIFSPMSNTLIFEGAQSKLGVFAL